MCISSTRPFKVYSANVGRPLKISIRKDTQGFISTDWYLEKVSSDLQPTLLAWVIWTGQKIRLHLSTKRPELQRLISYYLDNFIINE